MVKPTGGSGGFELRVETNEALRSWDAGAVSALIAAIAGGSRE